MHQKYHLIQNLTNYTLKCVWLDRALIPRPFVYESDALPTWPQQYTSAHISIQLNIQIRRFEFTNAKNKVKFTKQQRCEVLELVLRKTLYFNYI